MTKQVIYEKKILPYLGKRKLSEITAKDVIDWQNEMMRLLDILFLAVSLMVWDSELELFIFLLKWCLA